MQLLSSRSTLVIFLSSQKFLSVPEQIGICWGSRNIRTFRWKFFLKSLSSFSKFSKVFAEVRETFTRGSRISFVKLWKLFHKLSCCASKFFPEVFRILPSSFRKVMDSIILSEVFLIWLILIDNEAFETLTCNFLLSMVASKKLGRKVLENIPWSSRNYSLKLPKILFELECAPWRSRNSSTKLLELFRGTTFEIS